MKFEDSMIVADLEARTLISALKNVRPIAGVRRRNILEERRANKHSCT